MANLALWNLVSELKSEKYKWVDLTHEPEPRDPPLVWFQSSGSKTAV